MARRIRLLNADIDDITMDELLERREGTVLTLHVDMIAKLQKSRELYDLSRRFDVITCDSQILFFASRLFGQPFAERVSGSDYFPRFYMKYKDDPSVRIFLCGAMGDIAERAMARINERAGREIVVGACSPSAHFESSPEEIEKILRLINDSGATVLVVGITVPRQERFIFTYRDRLPGVRLFLPLGGTIDYEAGDVKRPPGWITTIGLEWFWRLAREPRRRWRRYIVDQPPVLWLLLRQRMGRYRDPFAAS